MIKYNPMKSKILTISLTAILTAVIILTIEFFLFGLNSKSDYAASLDSPDGLYKAYVSNDPAFDPPNQSLFISKNGKNEFRLVDDLPEDIEYIQKIYWSSDSKIVVFATNWHLILTNVDNFNSKKISLNPDWWKKLKKGTFISSKRIVRMKELDIINSDSLRYMTSEMTHPEKICLNDL